MQTKREFSIALLGTIDICRLNCVMVVLPGIILAALRDDDDRRK